jgi:hypothetical protein
LNSGGKTLWRKEEAGDEETLYSSLAVDKHGHSWLLLTQNDRVVLANYDDNGRRIHRGTLSRPRDGLAWSSDILLDRSGIPVVTFYEEPNGVPSWTITQSP